MKKLRLPLCILLIFTMFLAPVIGYTEGETADDAPDEVVGELPGEAADAPDNEVVDEDADSEEIVFSYSGGIDENGLWAGITALDYVKLPVYREMPIPADTHTIADDEVQEQIDSILSSYTASENVTDRAIEDGDTVNIDYVGSVDGVEFEGGTTGGAGTDVTIGVTNYIDDFLEQLIGHTPGETVNVEVTFPEEYGVDELNGQDAVFVTTINYIVATVEPELNDDFVMTNLNEHNGWTTVEEMREGIREDLKLSAIQNYIQAQLIADSTIGTIPDALMDYQVNAMMHYYAEYAGYFGMDLEDFITSYMGVSTTEELVELSYDSNYEAASFYLIVQAIAEDAGITVSEEDVGNYFKEYYDTDDYASYAESYGMPYLKQNILCSLALDYVRENAVLE